MTPLGWLFLIVSLTFVWSLTTWCFYRVLNIREEPPGRAPDVHRA